MYHIEFVDEMLANAWEKFLWTKNLPICWDSDFVLTNITFGVRLHSETTNQALPKNNKERRHAKNQILTMCVELNGYDDEVDFCACTRVYFSGPIFECSVQSTSASSSIQHNDQQKTQERWFATLIYAPCGWAWCVRDGCWFLLRQHKKIQWA